MHNNLSNEENVMKNTTIFIMKRILCALFSACMLFCLVACGGKNGNTTGTAGVTSPTEGRSPDPSGSADASDATPTENWEDPSLLIFRQSMVETPQDRQTYNTLFGSPS